MGKLIRNECSACEKHRKLFKTKLELDVCEICNKIGNCTQVAEDSESEEDGNVEIMLWCYNCINQEEWVCTTCSETYFWEKF